MDRAFFCSKMGIIFNIQLEISRIEGRWVMKRLLTMVMSVALLLGSIGEVPVYATPTENQAGGVTQESSDKAAEPADEITVEELPEEKSSDEEPEEELGEKYEEELTEESPEDESSEELPAEEIPEEAEAEETDSLLGIDGIYLNGTVNASELADNGFYRMTGNTTIIISEGDNIKIKGLINDSSEVAVNLTIQGSTAGVLRVGYIEISSPGVMSITGGTVVCDGQIKNIGNISISGGNISASTIYSQSDIEIKNSTVKVENLSDNPGNGCIHSRNILIENAKVTAVCKADAAIYAGTNLTIKKGAVNACNIGGTYAYGLWSVSGKLSLYDPLLDVEGGAAAIRSVGSIESWNTTAVTYPAGGTFGYGSDSGFWTVLDSEKKTAKEVHIESGNYLNTYDISADQTELDFGTSDYGVAPPDAVTIKITNNGNAAIRLDEIDTSTATAFTITPLSDTYLLSGQTATFTVRPKENLTAGEEFNQQIGIYTNRSGISISPITLKFKINPYQYKLTPGTSEVDFGSFKEENYPDGEQTIWLQNDSSVSNGTLHLKNEDLVNYFGLQKFTLESDSNQITKGNRINLTIRPRYDLEPGVHTETLVIDTVEGAKATINLKIEVVAWDYTITADKTTLDFGRANIGYTTAPEAKDIVITNKGEKVVTLCDPATFSSGYEISLKSGSLALGVDETLSLSVRPKVGLSGGNETIKIKTVQGSEVSVEVKFKVGHYLKGNVNASDLIDNEYYYVIGDTTINIAPGDDKKLRGIWGEQTTDEYNLIIQGSNAGRLSVEGPVYGSYDDSTKTLTIQGGTIECKFIRAGGNIGISGGDITTEYIQSKSGNVTISGGSLKAEYPEDWYSITGKDIVISGGYISASCKNRASIYATNDLMITGGVIKAKSNEGESSYGLYAKKNLSINGDAYITAEGEKEAIFGDPVSIAEGFQMRSGSDDVHISDSSSHWGHLVTVTDELVKSVTIGKDILGGSSREFNKEIFDFGTVVVEGEAVEAQAVLIRNTGSIPLVIESISAGNYIVEDLSSSIIGVGGTVTFKIRPDLEKSEFNSAGEKSETITIKFVDVEKTITAKIKMLDAAPAITVAPDLLDFGIVPVDYTGSFDTKTVVITNTGNVAVTLNEPTLSDTSPFTKGSLSKLQLAPGESAELTVSVKEDTAGTAQVYGETLAINGNHGVFASVGLNLEVKNVGNNIWIEDIPAQDYAGAAIKPEVNVYYGSRKLTDKDYSVSYKNNVNAADKDADKAPTVTVKGKGNYAGTATKTFTIKPLDISLADAPDLLYAYNKKSQYGKTKVTYNLGGKTVTLKEKTDFTYKWEDGTDYIEPATYTTTITGQGNYFGTKTYKEIIAGESQTLISKVSVPKIPDQPYQGKKIILDGSEGDDKTRAVDKKGAMYAFVIKNGKTELTYDTDYTLSYAENQEIGTATVTITGIGDYVGSRTVTFKITGTALGKAKTENFVSSMPYTGSERTQPMKFYFMKKNSAGENVKDYLQEGVHYKTEYANNTEIGTATVTYTGIGAYTGTVKKTYKITGTEMKNVTIPTDFSSAQGVVGGSGTLYYSQTYDSASKSFIYCGKSYCVAGLEDGTDNCGIKLKYYDKKTEADTPLTLGKDYTVSYQNNLMPGTATVIFTGIGKYTGTVKRTFKIRAYDFVKDGQDPGRFGTVTLSLDDSASYSKGGATPAVTIKFNAGGETSLESGKDYTVKYANNNAVTTETTRKKPSITVTGKGAFKGTITKEFTINKCNLNISSVSVAATDVLYKNKAGICKTNLTITDLVTGKKLAAGTDYDKNLKYTYAGGSAIGADDIIPAGTKIKVSFTGKGNYSGEYFGYFYFMNQDIAKATVTITPKKYTGNEITLDGSDITVRFGKEEPLTLGIDYEIVTGSYVNNVNKGTAKVTLRGKAGSGIGGTKTVSFNITARSMDYTIHYDGNSNAMAKKLYEKYGSIEENNENWYRENYRVTSMKDSVTTKGGKLPKNTIVVQKKTIKGGKETWSSVPSSVITFDKWTTEANGGGTAFENQGIFSPSWFTIFTYGNDISLYAKWE